MAKPCIRSRMFLWLSLAAGCTARQCGRSDVSRAWLSWDFELGDCTSLDLGYSWLGDEGARALAEALKTNKALTSLNIHSNSIKADGARALAQALKTNKALTSLILRNNLIGADGARALAEVLKSDSALTSLDLEVNSIGNEGARALAEALKSNGALASLDLGGNSIGNAAQRAVQAALAVSPKARAQWFAKQEEARLQAEEEERVEEEARSAEEAHLAAEAKAAAEARLEEQARLAEEARQVAEAQALERAKTLGIYEIFQELDLPDDALARAVRWCSKMGAESAGDLAYLRAAEAEELVGSLGLGLPILQQRKLADKLLRALVDAGSGTKAEL